MVRMRTGGRERAGVRGSGSSLGRFCCLGVSDEGVDSMTMAMGEEGTGGRMPMGAGRRLPLGGGGMERAGFADGGGGILKVERVAVGGGARVKVDLKAVAGGGARLKEVFHTGAVRSGLAVLGVKAEVRRRVTSSSSSSGEAEESEGSALNRPSNPPPTPSSSSSSSSSTRSSLNLLLPAVTSLAMEPVRVRWLA